MLAAQPKTILRVSVAAAQDCVRISVRSPEAMEWNPGES